jgi:NTP pyrophosphatase (non-canonical NTP hydrolase)
VRDWQHRVGAFARRHRILHTPATHALDLASEVGEVAKEILRATDYGRRSPRSNPQLAAELGDALYSLLALAEACHVDAETALEGALAKYESRLHQRGRAGST